MKILPIRPQVLFALLVLGGIGLGLLWLVLKHPSPSELGFAEVALGIIIAKIGDICIALIQQERE